MLVPQGCEVVVRCATIRSFRKRWIGPGLAIVFLIKIKKEEKR